MTKRIAIGVLCTTLALLITTIRTDPRPSGIGHKSHVCATRLNIAWSYDTGVTERLEEFQACVEGRP